MLDQTLTFSVDADGTTFVDEVFSRFETRQNISIYHGENNTISARNLLAFSRTMAKPSGNFLGFARTAFKTTEDVVVLGKDGIAQLTVPAIIKTEYVLPVGITDAQSLAIRRRHTAISADEAVILPLTMKYAI